MEQREKSEFGRGLVICLVKFAEHYYGWKEMTDLFDGENAVEMYFNGASDHLYEMQVPEEWKGTEIEEKVNKLRDKGLEIGHGFTNNNWKESDVYELHSLARDIAVLIDKKICIENAEEGQW